MPIDSLRKDISHFLQKYFIYFLPTSFLIYLALESYQIDFRSFYLAGKSAILGLDPYINYVGVHPDLYGPVNSELSTYSGFRYPPLAALLFAPLAIIPYTTAKIIFTLAMLLSIAILGFLMTRRDRFRIPGEAFLFIMTSFPVIALVERGQIDSLILLLTVLSYRLHGRKTEALAASFCLALAGVIKIFPLVTLIFYAANRQWRFISAVLLWNISLFFGPYLTFGREVYFHFLQRTLPEIFGQISSGLPLELHGQGIMLNKLVQTIDSPDLVLTHDFVNGFMNPLLKDSTVGSALSGLFLTFLLLLVSRRAPIEYRFFAFLNLINLYNPLSWIMGLIWYAPSFLYLYREARADLK